MFTYFLNLKKAKDNLKKKKETKKIKEKKKGKKNSTQTKCHRDALIGLARFCIFS